MSPTLLSTAATSLLLAANTMPWIPAPMYGSPTYYPPSVFQQYTAPSSNQYPIVGNDRDAYGCIPSAGYQWCELKERCIRPWEETCSSSTSYTPASSTFPYSPTVYGGCDRASGYIWCAARQTCIQPWVEDCAYPSTSRYYPTPDNTVRDSHGCITAQGYYWCEAQATCIQSGTTCTARNTVNGWMDGDKRWDAFGCDRSKSERWCDSKQSCIRTTLDSCPNDPWNNGNRTVSGNPSSYVPIQPVTRDANGCRSDYGYKWCASLDKCYRSWEERCPEVTDPVRARCTQTSNARICIGSPGFEWCESKRACVKIGSPCKY